MESAGILKKNLSGISHLPTIGLLIGYLVYWAELYFLWPRKAQTSLLATGLFLLFAGAILFDRREAVWTRMVKFRVAWKELKISEKFFVASGIAISAVIISIAFYAALLPPHLTQEFDVLNYHYTIARQHLILGSFKHLGWSSADLFLLPVDFALSPYWFATALPNKIPQFLFLLGLLGISVSLVRRFSKVGMMNVCIIVFAVLGSHFVAIQMGTAMLDIVLCYLFFACLDSLLGGNIFLCAVEFSFFLWSKPFIPAQLFFIFVALVFSRVLLHITGFKEVKWGFGQNLSRQEKEQHFRILKKTLILVMVLSIFIGSPFVLKSMYYAGTPLFPFFAGAITINKGLDKDPENLPSILDSAREHLRAKDCFGYGRSLGSFLKHLWLISVPEKDVNNRYDYPIGLIYLLFLGPFFYLFFKELRNKTFSILSFFIVLYWLCWWFGSQQSRFLYIPVLLMAVLVSSQIEKPTSIFLGSVIIALALTALSVYRANRVDLGRSREEVLRAKDRELVRLCSEYQQNRRSDIVQLNYSDAAFACFPVWVENNESAWVLKKNFKF